MCNLVFTKVFQIPVQTPVNRPKSQHRPTDLALKPEAEVFPETIAKKGILRTKEAPQMIDKLRHRKGGKKHRQQDFKTAGFLLNLTIQPLRRELCTIPNQQP